MNLALYLPRVRSSDLLGVITQLRIEHVRNPADTYHFRSFLNLELETDMESMLLAFRGQQPEKSRNSFTRLHPLVPWILVLPVVELARETEVVVWPIT